MKKVGKYLTITVLLLTGLFFIGLLYLFFVPKSTLFGITFISYNEKTLTSYYDASQVQKVVLNSHSYDIVVESSHSSKLYAKIENHSLGYVFTENKDLKVSESLTNNTLKINVVEPHGAAFKNNSLITIFLPKNQAIDLEIKNENAHVVIEDDDVMIRTLTYSAEKGNFDLRNATITEKLDLDLHKVNFDISSKAKLNACVVDLKITTGRFDASSSTLGNINILKNERGVILLNKCGTLFQREKVSGGRIEANEIGTLSFTGTDTNLYITKITNGAIVNITSGDIKISTLSGTSDIITENGNITIKTCSSKITTLTKDGNIKISKAYNKTSATTTNGDITVHFASDAEFATESNKDYRHLIAKSSSGNVKASGLNSAIIKVTNKGNINVSFENFEANATLISSIESNKGSIYIKTKKDSAYVLNSETKGSSRINLSQTEVYNGWTDKKITDKLINCDTLENKTNQFTIKSSSGNILMHDDNVN